MGLKIIRHNPKTMPPLKWATDEARLFTAMRTPRAQQTKKPDLVELLSNFTHLRWTIYGYFIGPCPFHKKVKSGIIGLGSYIEHEPDTLMVFPRTQTYHCTVCYNVQGLDGGSGNIVKATEWAARRIVKTRISV